MVIALICRVLEYGKMICVMKMSSSLSFLDLIQNKEVSNSKLYCVPSRPQIPWNCTNIDCWRLTFESTSCLCRGLKLLVLRTTYLDKYWLAMHKSSINA